MGDLEKSEQMNVSAKVTDPHSLAQLGRLSLIQARIDLNKGIITDGEYRDTLHHIVLNLAEAIETLTRKED